MHCSEKEFDKYVFHTEEIAVLYVYSMVYLHAILYYTESTKNMQEKRRRVVAPPFPFNNCAENYSESKIT